MSSDLEGMWKACGATVATALGCTLPAHFGDPGREWRAAREGSAVFAAGFRSLVSATGGDRVAFMQGMLSNDVKDLAPGQGVYAALLNQAGKVVSDLRVYAESERMLLDMFACRSEAVLEALDRFLVADDVELARLADDVPLLGLEGPFAGALLTEVMGADCTVSAPLSQRQMVFHGQSLRVVAASEINGNGILVCGDPTVAAPLFDACREAGAVPLGMEALNVLRIEAGIPWAGVDMDENILVMEAGLDKALSYTKGCYLGQEVVERVRSRGHVNRKLSGLLIDGEAVPASGAVVQVAGREVGYVSSAVRSLAFDRVIGLGMIHRNHRQTGERVEVFIGGTSVPAMVTAVPFQAEMVCKEE